MAPTNSSDKIILNLAASILGLFVVGCAARTVDGPTSRREREFFLVKTRQSPPQPVYNRLLEARPPDPLPLGSDSFSEPEEEPVTTPEQPSLKLQLKNSPLEQVAKIIAKKLGYTYYCSSFIATKTISLDAEGTPDQIVDEIAAKLGIHGVLDHEHQELRFLLRSGSSKASN